MPSINVDYATAFANAGLDFTTLSNKGVKCASSITGLKFAHEGEVIGSLPIPPGKISELATKFDPANQQHQTLKASLGSMFKKLEEKLNKPTPTGVEEPDPDPLTTTKPKLADAPKVGAAPISVATYPVHKMKTDTPVKLAVANALFQPVAGTSAGSRYYVVGLGTGIQIAARYKGSKLSVRIEGFNMAKLQQKIIEAGVFGPEFAGSFKADYASMHLDCPNKISVQRVIGAVLGSLAPHIGHATPDLQPLVDAA